MPWALTLLDAAAFRWAQEEGGGGGGGEFPNRGKERMGLWSLSGRS